MTEEIIDECDQVNVLYLSQWARPAATPKTGQCGPCGNLITVSQNADERDRLAVWPRQKSVEKKEAIKKKKKEWSLNESVWAPVPERDRLAVWPRQKKVWRRRKR